MQEEKKVVKTPNPNVFKDGINFFRHEHYFLSNFFPVDVEYEGILYHSSEAAYQAQKCRNPEIKKIFTKLDAEDSKKLGREVKCREDWEDIKIKVMKDIVRAKFTQNASIAKLLIDTGSEPLREGNYWDDKYWGVDNQTGEGENNLGVILMELRSEFQKTEV